MKRNAPKPDVFIFALNAAGGLLAEHTATAKANVGHTVECTREMVAGIECHVVRVFGKRPGEGVIAEDFKRKKKERIYE